MGVRHRIKNRFRQKRWNGPAGLSGLMLVIFLGLWVFPAGVRAVDHQGWPAYDEVAVESYCVIDAGTGEVILAKNPDQKRANASTTKIMTALILVEDEHFDPDQLLTVSKGSLIFSDPASVRLKDLVAGEQLRTADCLAALLIASANDMARVIAQNYGGTYGAVDPERLDDPARAQALFVERMNERRISLYNGPRPGPDRGRSHETSSDRSDLLHALLPDAGRPRTQGGLVGDAEQHQRSGYLWR